MTFSDILLKSFSEILNFIKGNYIPEIICLLFHLKTFFITFSKVSVISKNFSIFLFFCIFHENRRILNCFHRRNEFCMQKYPNKHIFVEFPDKE